MFWEKNSPPLDTNFRFWVVFLSITTFFLQTFCQLTLNLGANAARKNGGKTKKKMLSRNALVLGDIKGINIGYSG
jgi:hypothetical protein